MTAKVHEALNLIASGCRGITGTLEDHQKIQTALSILKGFVTEKTEDKSESEEEEK